MFSMSRSTKNFPQLKMCDNCEELFLLKCIFLLTHWCSLRHCRPLLQQNLGRGSPFTVSYQNCCKKTYMSMILIKQIIWNLYKLIMLLATIHKSSSFFSIISFINMLCPFLLYLEVVALVSYSVLHILPYFDFES
jgi:hypothetical protein